MHTPGRQLDPRAGEVSNARNLMLEFRALSPRMLEIRTLNIWKCQIFPYFLCWAWILSKKLLENEGRGPGTHLGPLELVHKVFWLLGDSTLIYMVREIYWLQDPLWIPDYSVKKWKHFFIARLKPRYVVCGRSKCQKCILHTKTMTNSFGFFEIR